MSKHVFLFYTFQQFLCMARVKWGCVMSTVIWGLVKSRTHSPKLVIQETMVGAFSRHSICTLCVNSRKLTIRAVHTVGGVA